MAKYTEKALAQGETTVLRLAKPTLYGNLPSSLAPPLEYPSLTNNLTEGAYLRIQHDSEQEGAFIESLVNFTANDVAHILTQIKNIGDRIDPGTNVRIPYFTAELASNYIKIVANHATEMRILDESDITDVRRDARRVLGFHAYPDPRAVSRRNDVEPTPPRDSAPTSTETAYITRNEDRTSTSINRLADTLASNLDNADARLRLASSRRAVCAISGLDPNTNTNAKAVPSGELIDRLYVMGPLRIKGDASEAKLNLVADDIASLEAKTTYSEYFSALVSGDFDYSAQVSATHVGVHSLLTEDGAHLRSIDKQVSAASYDTDASFDPRGEQAQIVQARLAANGQSEDYVSSRNIIFDTATSSISAGVVDGAGTVYGARLCQRFPALPGGSPSVLRSFDYQRVDKATVQVQGPSTALFNLIEPGFVFLCSQGVFEVAQALPDTTLRLRQYSEPGSSFIPDVSFEVPVPQELFPLATPTEQCQILVGGTLPSTLRYVFGISPSIRGEEFLAQSPRLGITLSEPKGEVADGKTVHIQDTVEYTLGEKITLVSNPLDQTAGASPNTTLEALRGNTLASLPSTDALTKAFLRVPDYASTEDATGSGLSAVIYTASNTPAFANSVFFGERGAQTADDISPWVTALQYATLNGVNHVSKSSLVEYILAESAQSLAAEHATFTAFSSEILNYFSQADINAFQNADDNKKRFTRIGVWCLYMLAFVAAEEKGTFDGYIKKTVLTQPGVNEFVFKSDTPVFDVSHVGKRVTLVDDNFFRGSFTILSVPRSSEALLAFTDGGPVTSDRFNLSYVDEHTTPDGQYLFATLTFCAGPGSWDGASFSQGSTSPNSTQTARLEYRFGRPPLEASEVSAKLPNIHSDEIKLVRTHFPSVSWDAEGVKVVGGAYHTTVEVVALEAGNITVDFKDINIFLEPSRLHHLLSHSSERQVAFNFQENSILTELASLGVPENARQPLINTWITQNGFEISGVLEAGDAQGAFHGIVPTPENPPLFLKVSHVIPNNALQEAHNLLASALFRVTKISLQDSGRIRAELIPAAQSSFNNALLSSYIDVLDPAEKLVCSVFSQEGAAGYAEVATRETWIDVSSQIGARINVPQINAMKPTSDDTVGVEFVGAPPIFAASATNPELATMGKVKTYRQVTGIDIEQREPSVTSNIDASIRSGRASASSEALRVSSTVTDLTADIENQFSDSTDIYGAERQEVFDRSTGVRIERTANAGDINTQALTVVRQSSGNGDLEGLSIRRKRNSTDIPSVNSGDPKDKSLPANGLAAFIGNPGEVVIHAIGDTHTQGKARISSDLEHSSYNYFGTGYRLLAGQQDHFNPTKPGRHRDIVSEQYTYDTVVAGLQAIDNDSLPQALGERGTQLAVEISEQWEDAGVIPQTNNDNYRLNWTPFEIPVPANANIVVSARSTKLPGVNKASVGRVVSIVLTPHGHSVSGLDRYYEGWPSLTAEPDNIFEAKIVDVQEDFVFEDNVQVLRVTVTLDSTPEANTATYDALNAYSSGQYAAIWLVFHGREWVLNARDINTSGYANWYSDLGILGATIEAKDSGITEFRGKPDNNNLNELRIIDWNRVSVPGGVHDFGIPVVADVVYESVFMEAPFSSGVYAKHDQNVNQYDQSFVVESTAGRIGHSLNHRHAVLDLTNIVPTRDITVITQLPNLSFSDATGEDYVGTVLDFGFTGPTNVVNNGLIDLSGNVYRHRGSVLYRFERSTPQDGRSVYSIIQRGVAEDIVDPDDYSGIAQTIGQGAPNSTFFDVTPDQWAYGGAPVDRASSSEGAVYPKDDILTGLRYIAQTTDTALIQPLPISNDPIDAITRSSAHTNPVVMKTASLNYVHKIKIIMPDRHPNSRLEIGQSFHIFIDTSMPQLKALGDIPEHYSDPMIRAIKKQESISLDSESAYNTDIERADSSYIMLDIQDTPVDNTQVNAGNLSQFFGVFSTHNIVPFVLLNRQDRMPWVGSILKSTRSSGETTAFLMHLAESFLISSSDVIVSQETALPTREARSSTYSRWSCVELLKELTADSQGDPQLNGVAGSPEVRVDYSDPYNQARFGVEAANEFTLYQGFSSHPRSVDHLVITNKATSPLSLDHSSMSKQAAYGTNQDFTVNAQEPFKNYSQSYGADMRHDRVDPNDLELAGIFNSSETRGLSIQGERYGNSVVRDKEILTPDAVTGYVAKKTINGKAPTTTFRKNFVEIVDSKGNFLCGIPVGKCKFSDYDPRELHVSNPITTEGLKRAATKTLFYGQVLENTMQSSVYLADMAQALEKCDVESLNLIPRYFHPEGKFPLANDDLDKGSIKVTATMTAAGWKFSAERCDGDPN